MLRVFELGEAICWTPLRVKWASIMIALQLIQEPECVLLDLEPLLEFYNPLQFLLLFVQ